MTTPHNLYFDYQATTPVDDRVLQKMVPFFTEKAGNPHSSDHSVGWQSSRAVADARHSIAVLIGANSDEIVFTSGATEANNLGLLGLVNRHSNKKRKRLLISAIEHKCVLAVARVLVERFGFQVDYIPVDKEGHVSVTTLKDLLDNDVLAVSVMAVNNEIGTIQDISGLSEASHDAGAIFHCDAAQAPVAMDLSHFAQNVDMLSLSAHKMYGPQGIGVLYVRRDLHDQIEPLIYGGAQQEGLRSGTVPVPLCVGMGEAAELMCAAHTKEQRAILCSRRDRFIGALKKLPWDISLNGSKGLDRHPGNANILFHGFDAHDILGTLQPHLAASTGSACTSGTTEPSHVLKAIGLNGDNAEASVRFSLGFGTSDDDINSAIALISTALKRLSETSMAQSV